MSDNGGAKDTQFKPGQSGNPFGRPKGSRPRVLVALDALAEGEAEEIVKTMIAKAKDGDSTAGRTILERIWPARKGARVQFSLPAVAKPEDLPAAIGEITRQVAGGEISPDEGAIIMSLLDAHRKALETVDLAARVAAIEERLGK